MENGKIWKDTNGNKIHAHGGCRLDFNGIIYWYGENRIGDNYVSCYKSLDNGKTWTFCNNVLTKKSKSVLLNNSSNDLTLVTDNGDKVNIERPKVIYNKKTNKFVMWAHYENGVDYSCARSAIATCDTPDGDFIYHGSFRPLDNMSRDCTLYVEGEDAYFISAANKNADLLVYKLTEDYLGVEKLINKLFVGEFREAPCLIKFKEKYYIFTSGCTGWQANQLAYSSSNKIDGEWKANKFIGDATTFGSQGAFVYLHEGKIVYLGDRWGGDNFTYEKEFDYFKSAYVQYEIKIIKDKADIIYSEQAII